MIATFLRYHDHPLKRHMDHMDLHCRIAPAHAHSCTPALEHSIRRFGMGNTLHAAVRDPDAFALADAILPFDNLLVPAIEAHWRSFFDCATSFALTQTQLRQICCRAACALDPSASTQRVAKHADRVFELFLDPHLRSYHHQQQQQQQYGHHHHPHQQQRQLPSTGPSLAQYQQQQQQQSAHYNEQLVIDALEFFSAIAFVSAASLDDKIDLIFDSWDMSEDGALDLDEFTISLKSTLTGLSRILKPVGSASSTAAAGKLPSASSSSSSVLDEDEVDALADRVFREVASVSVASSSANGSSSANQLTITCEQFRDYCTRNKAAKSLFAFFDLADASLQDDDNDDDGDAGDAGDEGDINSSSRSHNQALGCDAHDGFDEARRLKQALAKTDATTTTSEATRSDSNNTQSTIVDVSAGDDHGDEFLAVKPWKGAIVAPSKAPPVSRAAPLVSIKLEWIFGYSAQEARNNVRYVASTASASNVGRPDEIAYPAAAACVVLNTRTMTQRHHLAHTDDVLCLCLHPKLPIAASGELGRRPKLMVWDVSTMETLCVLQGFHQRGVVLVAFQTETTLVSIGGDDDHSIAIYASTDAWHSATLQVCAKGNKAVPFHLVVHPSLATEFVVCGQKSIEFWTIDGSGGKSVSGKKALLGKRGALQPFLVAEYVRGSASSNSAAVVVGTHDGHLYLFSGRDLASVVKAHSAAVNALHYIAGLLVSGSRDGTIVLWDDKLQQVGGPIVLADTVLATVKHTQYFSVRSCCLSPDKKTILLGTQASEIYEIDARSGQNVRSDALARGHFHGELWGLAVHPHKQQVCTVGDDQTLRIWDLETKRELRSVRLDCPGRACAYSGDGKLIAVGLGSDGINTSRSSATSAATAKKAPVKTKDTTSGSSATAPGKSQTSAAAGGFAVYSESDLVRVREPCFDPRKWVSDVKFSPDSRVLAVASHDTNVYFYDVLKGFNKTHVFKKHSSYVSHVDFSSDGRYLQSTCGAYELLFSDVKTAKHMTSAAAFRDERWHTMTATLGWAVQGIWPPESDGTDVNALDRSHDGALLATGDDSGSVKVFQYPCVLEHASFVELRGHASHVTTVRWSAHDSALVSVGGNDRCVFVWRHERTNGRKANEDDLFETDAAVSTITAASSSASLEPSQHEAQRIDPLELAGADDDVGDEFMAVKPWLGAVVAPSNASAMTLSSAPPDAHLELECVHGYQAQSSANNARYDASGNVVYHAAALGIVVDKATQRQRFVKSHDDDIVALAAHPNGAVFATAQMGKRPKIYTWLASTCATLSCLEGFHQRFVSALSFSSDGKKLGSVGGDDDHSLAIYAWESGLLLASAKGERNSVASMCYYTVTGAWVTCGDKHIRFWTEQGKTLTSKKAIFGSAKHKDGKMPSAFGCVVAFRKLLVAGASNGDLYVFQSSNELARVVTAHASHATALYTSGTDARELVTGGKDGKILVWDADVKPLASIDLKTHAAAVWLYNATTIRSVCTSSRSSRVFLVGTGGSDLIEVDASRSTVALTIVTQGHHAMEVWGLACHPQRPEYCTVGDDQTLRVWCLKSKTQLRTKRLECLARACAISDTLDVIAVGYGGRNAAATKGAQAKTGTVVLVRYSDLASVFEDKPSKQAISAVAFAPSGAAFAVGSHDHHVYVYKIHDASCKRVTKTATFSKHQSYITHLDFSRDSSVLQSTCGAYELLFSDATTGRHITSASSTRDTDWHTWTCVLGWPVQGIWPPCSDGTDVNAVDRNAKRDLLVTSDDFGLVKLYRYPCVAKHASALEHRGHSSHVTNVRWSAGDAYVVSVGGNDRCVMEWRVVRDSNESGATDAALEHDVFASSSKSSSVGAAARNSTAGSDSDNDDGFETDPAGDEFLAVKPWIGAIVAPSNAPTPNSREPDVQLELEWVYGYQTELSHQNLVYNDRDEIVYHTAAVGVIYDPVAHLQRHHVSHSDDILSFALASPARSVVATGERGKKPGIRLWDARTGELRCEMRGFHTRGVVSLAFSQDMTLLASVGDDDDHSVALWEDASNGSWTLAKLRATAKGDKGVNAFAAFGPGNALVTGGAKHVLFWSTEGKTLVAKRGRVGKRGTLQLFPCGCAFGSDGDFVTGTASGELYVWRGDEVSKVVKAHDSEATVVYAHNGDVASRSNASPLLLSGGKDGKVLLWNTSFQSLKCFDLAAMSAGCLVKAVCSVFLSANGHKLLIGTRSSDIVEVDVATGTLLHDGRPLFSGHYLHELWGLAVHPTRHEFITTGDDSTLRVWDMATKQLTRLARLPTKARACAIAPDGAVVAVGLGGDTGVRRKGGKAQAKSRDGGVLLLNMTSESLDAAPAVLFEDAPAKEWISDVKYSPCGSLVAFGSHDNAIYFYALQSHGGAKALDVKKRKAFAKHNSYITHLDFSDDSKFVQSNCGAYELLFCDATTSEHVRSASAVKNVKWATWTCTLGWPVQGIWPECADGTDINAVCASASRTILATGDDSSLVKLFRYPCTVKGVRPYVSLCVREAGWLSSTD